ncbi:PPE family protein [Mycobacterium sp. Marseille-P9652]|uniref:PPE family protein n=1 Tax=Mycobacterium sp. Marseille-P9652 TaxID=2654950 RepID=UPI0012E800EC|nr:PPE family protein [Mycobacterium sp. Marseille-P9652]
MSAPIWMASPPEVHSALLSTGPGPGSLLAAAGSWTSLSAEYTSAAAELGGMLASVQAGAWEGPTAERYVAAHAPYLAWLQQAGADSAGVAAQHEVAATAYTAALAVMPTVAELVANHVIHGVLLATNFFGINTIPIALNEADYARMWVQAATAMSAYQAASGAALASAPRTGPAPSVVKPGQAASSGPSLDPAGLLSGYQNLMSQFTQLLQNPVGTLQQIIAAFSANPVAALIAYGPLLLFTAYEVISPIATYGPMLAALPLSLSLALGALTLLAAGPIAPVAVGAAAATPVSLASTGSPAWPVAGLAPSIPSPAAAPVTANAPAAGPPAASAPAVTTAGFAYAVAAGAGPESDPGPTLIGRGGAKAPAATIPAAAAAVRRPAEARARRRRRAAMREYGDEFVDMDSDIGVTPEYGRREGLVGAVASGNGAGALGFAGTARKTTGFQVTGLTTVGADELAGGARLPMMPGTWEHPGAGEGRQEGGDSEHDASR